MEFLERVNTLTQEHIIPVVVDTVLNSNVLTSRLMKNPRQWTGGTKQDVIVKVEKSTSGGSFSGLDVLNVSQSNTRIKMAFDPRGAYQSVPISNMERAVNKGTEKILDLVGVEMESAKQDLADTIGTMFYSDGTGNGGKDFTGLAAAVDDGSVAATYGGQARATYTTLQSDVTAAVGNLTLSGMATSYDAAKKGSDAPTLILTTETVWNYYEQLLQPTISANYQAGGFAKVTSDAMAKERGGLVGEAGFDAVFYRGKPVVADEKCTAGYMYFLNENYIHWFTLEHPDNTMSSMGEGNIEGVYSKDEKPPVFSWTGFVKPSNQDGLVGQFITYGELINRNPNRSSVMQGITGV